MPNYQNNGHMQEILANTGNTGNTGQLGGLKQIGRQMRDDVKLDKYEN